MTVTTEQVTLRVQRVRASDGRSSYFSGLSLNDAGVVYPQAPRYAVSIPSRLLTVMVEQGQWWQVYGRSEAVVYEVDGWRVHERRIVASEATLIRPSGEHIVQLLACSPAFPGIGDVTARRLWDALGEDLYTCLEDCDRSSLEALIGSHLTDVILEGWAAYGNADAIRFFQRVGFDLKVARRILEIYEDDALDAIRSDPYRLLTFGMTWLVIDELAKSEFGLDSTDSRRLIAAVELVLHRALDTGHMYLPRVDVESEIGSLVGEKLVPAALKLAIENSHVVQNKTELHALGPWVIESSLANAFCERLTSGDVLMSQSEVESIIADFEMEEARLQADPHYELNAAQRESVMAVVTHNLVLITGGAGVGKTTVLKCIYRALDSVGRVTYQMALSGRAAKRIADATGKPAMTIAGFLQNVAKQGMSNDCVLIVDEASMLDELLAYRLIRSIPTSTRLIFVGDPYQLPPIGPGLILQALVHVSEVPNVELTEVRRFGGVIAAAAAAIRCGSIPTLSSNFNNPISFIECDGDSIEAKVLELLSHDPKNTQVLTFTRKRGIGSSLRMNMECQVHLNEGGESLLVWNDERDRMEDTGLKLDDPVLCTRNLWNFGIQNGSLGRIHTIEPTPLQSSDGKKTYGWVRWDDGELRPLTLEVLDSIELGYAVTVHKAQGSQFKRVIIPVTKSWNLDRTMVYTAITRAIDQVVLVGDLEAFNRAVAELPHASLRKVALGQMLGELMEA